MEHQKRLSNHNSSRDHSKGENSNPKGTTSRLKESILGLPRRLIGSNSSQDKGGEAALVERELKVVGEESWVVYDSPEDSPDMSSGAAATTEGRGSSAHQDGFRRRTNTGSKAAADRAQLSTPPLGGTSKTVSSKKPPRPSSPHGSSSSLKAAPRPPSPHGSTNSTTAAAAPGSGQLSRKSSARSSRASNLEVQNGAVHRGVSPARTRSGSPTRGGSASGKSSPTVTHAPARSVSSSSVGKRKGILVNNSESSLATAQSNHVSAGKSMDSRVPAVVIGSSGGSLPHSNGQTHQVNGKSAVATASGGGQHDAEDAEVGGSAFEKVRDTLRISRPKKKKKGKGKKQLAYSIVVDPAQLSTPEINLHEPDKYQDPFEASFDENGDPDKKMDHVFSAVSIPHNKPEYCDHCGDMAWGLYRQVLKCQRCNFIAHRKCESKVIIGCSLRLEQAILQHDKQVEDVERMAAREEVVEKEKKKEKPSHPPSLNIPDSNASSAANPPSPTTPPTPTPQPTPAPTTSSSASSSSVHTSSAPNPQLLSEKAKLSRKIREYNRKTTPVHHIHIKSSFQASDPNSIEYHGFVRVHMHVQRPIHVSTAITRTSWYRLMRPVKERTLTNDVDGYEIQTAFYLPLDTNRLVHIQNTTTTKELIQILLKKFCVTDNPKKFSLYEEYGGDCRRLFEEDRPLEISLDASVSHRNSKLVLRDNTYSTIQWDAFSSPELSNFIQILEREEELYADKLKERFGVWRKCINQAIKEKYMEEQAKKTKKTVGSRLLGRGKSASPKNSLKTGGRSVSPMPSRKTSNKKKGDSSPSGKRSHSPSGRQSHESSPVPAKKAISAESSLKKVGSDSPAVKKAGESSSSSKKSVEALSGKKASDSLAKKTSTVDSPAVSKKGGGGNSTDSPAVSKKGGGGNSTDSPAVSKKGGGGNSTDSPAVSKKGAGAGDSSSRRNSEVAASLASAKKSEASALGKKEKSESSGKKNGESSSIFKKTGDSLRNSFRRHGDTNKKTGDSSLKKSGK